MARTPLKKRSAFTLVELLIVIGIIVVLIALLLPAVQRIQETASQTTCKNNLRQLGIALTNYHASSQRFPPGVNPAVVLPPASFPVPGLSWTKYILPQIDQGNLAPWSANWTDPANSAWVNTQLKVFRCPSSPSGPRLEGNAAPTDYAPTAGIGMHAINNVPLANLISPPAQKWHGVLFEQVVNQQGTPTGLFKGASTKLSEISDGASNTIMLAEVAGRPEGWLLGMSQAAPSPNSGWANPAHAIVVNGPLSPNCQSYVNCSNNDEIFSFHPGGAHVLMADGSVRLLAERIPLGVLAKLVTRDGKEPITGAESDF